MLGLGHTNSTGNSDRAVKVRGPRIGPMIGVIADQVDRAVTTATQPVAIVVHHGFVIGSAFGDCFRGTR